MMRASLFARIGLALAALVVPVVLTGCGGSLTTSGDQAVTSISDMETVLSPPYIEAVNKCAAKAGVTLNRQVTPYSGYLPKVLQQASSKTLPDVLGPGDDIVPALAATGALAPLSDFHVITDGFAQGVLRANTYDGKVYGLQPTVNTVGLFYNKDLFAKAGVQPPTTWDELKAAAAKLSHGDQYGIAFSASASPTGTSIFLPVMWGNGGDEKNIATPQTAEALQLWVDLVKSGSASSGVLNWSAQDVVNQFEAGKAAMMISTSGVVVTLDKVQGLNFGTVQIPIKVASDTAVAPLGGTTWAVTRSGSKAKQAKAAEVVACINSDENQLSIAKGIGEVPSKTTLAAQFAAENPKLAVFADLLKNGRAYTGELGADWPKAEVKIHTAIQTALTGKASPSDALKQAQNNG